MNPKHIRAQKDGKVPLEFLIYSVLAEDALVHKSGANKYGVRNWRVDKILASTYEGAILRHFIAWASGEDIDPESGVHHLAHVRACCAIVRDAAMRGMLIDDRDRQESKRPEPEDGEPFPAHQGYPAPRCAKCKDQPCTCYEPVPPGEPEDIRVAHPKRAAK